MNVSIHVDESPLVLIVDDDEDVRMAIEELLVSVGMEAHGFGSTRELLDSPLLQRASCLVLDVRMPGVSGLDLQQRLSAAGASRPIVFLTGHGDIPMSVQAMKAGAIDFLTKPVRDQTLIDAVIAGVELDAKTRETAKVVKEHVDRFETLTPRESQVMREVARGRLNKQIAYDLGITEITVKLHRSNVMKKMQVASIGELIRAWEILPEELRQGQSA